MKKKTSISDRVLEQISQKQIKPIPRWEFVVKSWGLWTTIIISFGLLFIGVGESWFGLIDNVIVPYLWMVLTMTFVLTVYFLFQKTKKAYRVEKSWVLVAIMAIGILAGGIIFKSGMANRIDRGLGVKSNYYRTMVPMRMQAWGNPAAGYLSGTITKVTDNNNFDISDFAGKQWKINGKNLVVRNRVSIQIGEEVKLVGSQSGVNSFDAEEVRPWNGMMQNMMKEN